MKNAWVFNGCGALGAVQAGIATTLLMKKGLPDAIYGVSSGAVNAVAYGYMNSDGPMEFWSRIGKFTDAFSFNWLTLLSSDGLFRPSTNMIKSFRGLCSFDDPHIPLTVFTTRNVDGELLQHNLTPGQTSLDSAFDAAIAACSIPGIVQSHRGEADAGFRMLAPLKWAIQDGCEKITLISGRPIQEKTLRDPRLTKTLAAGYQSIDLALSEILRRDIRELEFRNSIPGYKQITLEVIQPKETYGGPLDFAKCKEFVIKGVEIGKNV
jgi:predicted acylesterase/phospholipase RssA